MANVLNLALKKDVYEGLINKTTNEIPIDKSDWWTKRLMDQDTGRFKEFDVVSASCGSADKIEYPIVGIEDKGSRYIITVVIADDTEVDEPSVEDTPVEDNPETPVVETKSVDTPSPKEEVHTEEPQNEPTGVKERVLALLDEFCKNERVFNITTPNVFIRANGQVVSSGKSISSEMDSACSIPLTYVNVIKYDGMSDDDFVDAVSQKFEQLLSGCYVFIRKGLCGFSHIMSGESVFVIRVATRKAYLFKQR